MSRSLVITIFGSTGDLTARKILPALNQLIKENKLTQSIKIYALGRKNFNDDQYFTFINTISNHQLEAVKPYVSYIKLDIMNLEDYHTLKKMYDQELKTDTRHLIYLALAPDIMVDVSKFLSESDIVKKDDERVSIIFEKPFGHDLDSARQLNQILSHYYLEEQMYRIDHYLGKEMIQNLIQTRFYNEILNAVWHKESIKSVSIFLKEKDGILNRAAYYDSVGALKDMMQSHLLQIVALIAMDEPKSMHSSDIKEAKVNVLNQLTFDPKSVFMGQYIGYKDEVGVDATSTTETFVSVKAYVNTKRFENVPFYLITGKKLNKKESYIEILFKQTHFQTTFSKHSKPNILRISIDPIDGFSLSLNSKKFGLSDETESLSLTFHPTHDQTKEKVEAYEKLLFDAIYQHKTLFTSWDEIESSWTFADALKQVKRKLIYYKNEDYLLNYLKGCGLYEDL